VQIPVVEQIREFDTNRAILDQNNAALVYAQVMANYLDSPTISDLAITVDETLAQTIHEDLDLTDSSFLFQVTPETYSRAWTSDEFPEIANLINKHANHISILAKASEHKDCFFLLSAIKLSEDAYHEGHHHGPRVSFVGRTYQSLLLDAIERYRDLLVRAAFLDAGEGRHAEAIAKAETLIRIGHHLCQFPTLTSLRSGMDAELDGLNILNMMIIAAPTELLNLDSWYSTCHRADKHWLPAIQQADRASELVYREGLSRLKKQNITVQKGYTSWWSKLKQAVFLSRNSSRRGRLTQSDFRHSIYLPTAYRLQMLLIKLRRHKDQTGQWPRRLEEATKIPAANVLEELNNQRYPRFPMLWYSNECFVLFGQKPETIRIGAKQPFTINEVFVYDSRTLTEDEEEIINRHVNYVLKNGMLQRQFVVDESDYLSRMAPYSVPMILKLLQNDNTETRMTTAHTVSFMGKKKNASLCGYTRDVLLKAIIDSYHREKDKRLKFLFIMHLQEFDDLPEDLHIYLVETLQDIIRNSPVPHYRGTAAHVLLKVSPEHGLPEILDNLERLSDKDYFGENRQDIVWKILNQTIGPKGYYEYIHKRSNGTKSYGPTLENLKILERWWQENKRKFLPPGELKGIRQINGILPINNLKANKGKSDHQKLSLLSSAFPSR